MYPPTVTIAAPERMTVMATVRSCREDRHRVAANWGQARHKRQENCLAALG
jgi:hypothetical protein